jgi:hypothetical protein
MSSPAGNYCGLNLGPRYAGAGSHVALNLGVEWSDTPTEPPDPTLRDIRITLGLPWGHAEARVRTVATMVWRQASQLQQVCAVPWSLSSRVHRTISLVWGAIPQVSANTTAVWGSALPRVARTIRDGWASLQTRRTTTAVVWSAQGLLQRSTGDAWRYPGLERASTLVRWRGQLLNLRRGALLPYLHPGLAKRTTSIPWGNAGLIPWIVRPPRPPVPPAPGTSFPPGNWVGLNLGCPPTAVPGIVPLNLGVTACYAVRPRRRTYVVKNSLSVVRLPDRLPIEVDSVGISGSVDSWGYAIDLTLTDHNSRADLAPTVAGPRQVEITLNGYVWTGIVESFERRRQIDTDGRPSFSVSMNGRSRTALLAAPYAPGRTKVTPAERSVAQLVDEELQDTGYTATYDTVDWIVPAGAWYYDATPALEAITRLAEASGAVVQSDPEGLSITVRPRYPASPWDWPTTEPAHFLQDDIVLADGMSVRSQPLFDAVVVTGEIQGKGVTAVVKRSGEAGTLYAPQASSPLINTDAAAAERGRNVLSDRGEQAAVDLTLPLFPSPLGPAETGRVLPLDLVEVQEADGTWQGLCTAIRVDARRDGGALVIEQTITLERHLSDAN